MAADRAALPCYSSLNFMVHQGDDVWLLSVPVTFSDHRLPYWLLHLPGDDWFDLCLLEPQDRKVEFSES